MRGWWRLGSGWLLCGLVAALMAPGPALAQEPAALAQGESVLVARVDGPITPVVADYLTDGVREAARYQALLVELDTPGGLDTSMRQIIKTFLSAEVPVVVYVTPPGGRAASAGALITLSAHVAAMAPGTTIGAATPVNLESGEVAGDKVVNDAAAFAEAVAAQRGRSTQFAVDAVREGRAVTAEEAVRIGAVDLVAADRAALLAAIDGRAVSVAGGREVILHTAGAGTVDYETGLLRGLLQLLADPNLAFLFLSIGTLAVIYELASPGAGLGGAIGAILLILGFFALSVLPVTVAGLALLVLAAALFAAEVFTPGVGVFAAGGTLALLAAGLFLFEGSVRVSPMVLLPTALIVGGGTLLAGRLAWRARRRPPVSGAQTLLGAATVVAEMAGDTAQVRLEGAWWNARSSGDPLHKGQSVRVIGMQDLTLIVEPDKEPDKAAAPDHVPEVPDA